MTVPAQQQRPAFDGTLSATTGPSQLFSTELLSRIWQQNLPVLRERLAILDRAAQAALQGTLTPAEREKACDVAHKLAGSLGMFGFHEGTRIARELEQLLDAPGTVPPEPFLRLTAELHATLPL